VLAARIVVGGEAVEGRDGIVLDVDRTRTLNDILRRSLSGGLLMLTAGIVALGRES
jgi:hypothetical protein